MMSERDRGAITAPRAIGNLSWRQSAMQTVLVIEEDTLIRELMREHLEREGYVVCAVASVRAALDATRWTRFLLVLLDFAGAASSDRDQLEALRRHGAPVLMMRSAPAGTATVNRRRGLRPSRGRRR